jgi:RNA polymerase sigma-54 factor
VTAALALEARPQLELRVSPELIAYAGLLALPALELEQAVERELALNPALERVEPPVCAFCGEPLDDGRCLVCARPPRQTEFEPPIEVATAAEPSAAEAFLADVRPLVRADDVAVLEHVVGSLDERGFIDATPDEVAARLELPRERVDRVLCVVRRHGPAGIAPTDVRECLLLQLDLLDGEPEVPLVRAVVAAHLERLAFGHWHAIAEALGVTRQEVASAADFIRTRLRPSAPLEPPEYAAPAPPVLPDVIVHERDDSSGTFVVELVEPRRLCLVVASSYGDADLRQLDPKARAQVEEQLAQARSFLRRLDRRWQTMRTVAEVIVERQRDFILHGARFITPLTRAEVAADLGVHESTVSRATSGRYVLLPSGCVVPFARFFDDAQGPCAALAQIVADEESPRSDADLAAELAQLGFAVARRTVAKYRDRLGIPPHTRR